jgi:hypothetical protein
VNVSSFLLASLLCPVLVAAVPSAAVAADEIGLSKDGSSWSTTLSQPLFDPNFRWVPGDDETSSFFVRNQGPSGAALTISAISQDTDQLLSNEDIDLFARADDGPWVELQNGVASTALTQRAITQGGIARIDVRARFDPVSVNQSMTKRLPLRFVVTLAEAFPSSGSTGRDDNDDDDGDDTSGSRRDGDLPGAGSSLSPAPLWVAAMLIGGGLALAKRSRRGEVTTDV